MLVSPIPQEPAPVVGADLIGSWSLESYKDTAEGAEAILPLGINPTGLLIYTPGGFVSAQLMRFDRSSIVVGDWDSEFRSDGEKKSENFIGYSGEYQFDEVTATVTHIPSVSFVPTMIGQRLRRQVKLHGSRLTLTVVTPKVGGQSVKSTLCWLKVPR
jgi:hypothetical protein